MNQRRFLQLRHITQLHITRATLHIRAEIKKSQSPKFILNVHQGKNTISIRKSRHSGFRKSLDQIFIYNFLLCLVFLFMYIPQSLSYDVAGSRVQSCWEILRAGSDQTTELAESSLGSLGSLHMPDIF